MKKHPDEFNLLNVKEAEMKDLRISGIQGIRTVKTSKKLLLNVESKLSLIHI